MPSRPILSHCGRGCCENTSSAGRPPYSRVLRGGSWFDDPSLLRSAFRDRSKPSTTDETIGFRLILVPGKTFNPHLKRMTVALAPKVSIEFVQIRAGEFRMGFEGGKDDAAFDAVLTRDYWMQTTEVTQAQWTAVVGPRKFAMDLPDLPLRDLPWNDAQEFVKKLAPRCKGGRPSLPTEAEWEYACRAGTTTLWYWGDDPMPAIQYGWFYATPNIQPVARKRPNPWGLYDMAGNASEWCLDWCAPYPKGKVVDPTGPKSAARRIVRGGFYGGDLIDGQSYSRKALDPAVPETAVGFRIVIR